MDSERRQITQAVLQAVAQDACADGNMVEFHWRLFRRAVLPADLSEAALCDIRGAFLCGAESTFAFLDSLARDDNVGHWYPHIVSLREEFACIQDELSLRYGAAAGSA